VPQPSGFDIDVISGSTKSGMFSSIIVYIYEFISIVPVNGVGE